jgi:hypothetical protein
MPNKVYHVYLLDSRNPSNPTFIGPISASSEQDAIAKARRIRKINDKLRPGSPFSLAARTVQEDISESLDGNSSTQIITTIHINQNTAPILNEESQDTDMFNCDLNSLITNISTAINENGLQPNCTIDINQFIRCLSEKLEHYPDSPEKKKFEKDLQLESSSIGKKFRGGLKPENFERWLRFKKLALAFKYNLFPQINVPLKLKDSNNSPQDVSDFEEESINYKTLNRYTNELNARIKQIKQNRNIKDKQTAINTDAKVLALRNLIQQETNKINNEKSNDCPGPNDCYITVTTSPIFKERKVNLANITGSTLVVPHSHFLKEVANILKQNRSVPIMLKTGPEYKGTVTNNDIDTIILNSYTGWQGFLHQVSIIGIETDNDNSVTLTIQDSYSIRGSNEKNIFKLKLTNNYFETEMAADHNKELEYNIGFDDAFLANKTSLFLGMIVNIQTPSNSCECITPTPTPTSTPTPTPSSEPEPEPTPTPSYWTT